MDGIADMGGTDGWGPAPRPVPGQPVFAETWEGRAFALMVLATRQVLQNRDASRHALERLDRSAYLDEGYYGRWLNGAELVLVESAILAAGAVDARARRLRGEDVEEPPIPEPNKPDYAPTAPGSLRTVDVAPAFAVGDKVRARSTPSAGHTRLPRYVRGHTGVVELVQPAAVLPDTNAHFQGENPQHVYTVSFDSHELWGSDAETFTLTIEMFESYLKSAT